MLPVSPTSRRTSGNSVTRDMNKLIHEIDMMVMNMQSAARAGMSVAQDKVYADAVNTQAYDDDTTATRNSTTTYVADGTVWPHPEVERSRNTANAFRPGSGAPDNAPPQPPANMIVLDLIVSTNYSLDLNTRFGGRSMFVANAILSNGGVMMDLVANAVTTAMSRVP